MNYSLLVADDHPMILEGIQAMFQQQTRFNVKHTATSGAQAWALVQAHSPSIDVVVTDIQMPHMNGVELVRNIKSAYPQIRVLVISMHQTGDIIRQVLEAEAEGCILKDVSRKDLLDALERIVQGKTAYSSEWMVRCLREQGEQKESKATLDRFSPREREVLNLIFAEKTSEEIAEALCISRRTVDIHRQHIMEKSEQKTLVGLIKFAYRMGMR